MSTEAKVAHTPGPWVYRTETYADDAGDVVVGHWIERGNTSVASLTPYGDVEANGRLIAAAPEMYDALQRISSHFADTDAPLGIAARELLQRIEGAE